MLKRDMRYRDKREDLQRKKGGLYLDGNIGVDGEKLGRSEKNYTNSFKGQEEKIFINFQEISLALIPIEEKVMMKRFKIRDEGTEMLAVYKRRKKLDQFLKD
jgi:hypothetical protein